MTKNFFFQSEHVSSQIWCKKFFPLLVGGRERKRALDKIFFPQSEHVSSQIWCQKIFPLLRLGTPPPPDLRQGLPPLNLDLGPPSETGTPPHLDLGPPGSEARTPPGSETWDPPTWTWEPPPLNVNRQTPVKTVSSRRTTYAGGNYGYFPYFAMNNIRAVSTTMSDPYSAVYSIVVSGD